MATRPVAMPTTPLPREIALLRATSKRLAIRRRMFRVMNVSARNTSSSPTTIMTAPKASLLDVNASTTCSRRWTGSFTASLSGLRVVLPSTSPPSRSASHSAAIDRKPVAS